MNKLDLWENIYTQFRPYLISLSFRMTGSLAEAEEIVQDTFLECSYYFPSEISNHKAWLTKICTNKSINHLQSAKKRREVYPGVWLPDEIPEGMERWSNEEVSSDLSKSIELSESLTTSFLLLLEKLTPEQRAVFLLRDVFSYEYSEISELTGKSKENCRKIAQRSKEIISSEKVKFSNPPENALEIISDFFQYAKKGDREGLKKILSEDAELFGDGGGKVKSAGHLFDREEILNFLLNLGQSEIFRSQAFRFEYRQVNQRPGLVISKKEAITLWKFDTVLCVEFFGNSIHRIYAQRNPDKLQSLIAEQ